MRYVKFMPFNTVENASRNKREMSAAAEYGYEVWCYSSDRKRPGAVRGEPFRLICSKTPEVSYKLSKPRRILRIICNYFRIMKRLRALEPDVISCHNISALCLAYAAYWGRGKSKKPKLIYDSHEFELARKKRNPLFYQILKMTEGFLMKRCVYSIMINQGIADAVYQLHGIKQEPVIVRSIPEYWELSEEKIDELRAMYHRELNAPDSAILLVYTGYVMPYRGLEAILDALAADTELYSVWIGDAPSKDYEEKLLKKAEELQIRNRILRIPQQPHAELRNYIAAGSVQVVMHDTEVKNYEYALPNKFFEGIQAAVPIICTDSIEMARIVNESGIGICIPSGDGNALACAAGRLQNTIGLYDELKENVTKAKEVYCWENEKQIFFRAFERYLGQGESYGRYPS